MNDFAVIAQLPLGAYRARTPGGHLDPVPSPVRLHAALLCAAATGPRARDEGGALHPSETDLGTLQWLEQHPPDGVALPRTVEVRTSVYGYRREGTLVTEGGRLPFDKVVSRSLVGLVAVDGAFAWTWREPPPAQVQDSLAALCGDVAHLGNADTPVRLRVGEASPTHRRDLDADLFASAPGLDVDVADVGRTSALRAAHAVSRKPVSASKDAWSPSGDVARSAGFVETGRTPARYLSLADDDEPDAPWSTVLLAGFGGAADVPRGDAHVRWATAVHRALICLVGDGAPAVLTGNYLDGVPRPANRVAVQLLAPEAVRAAGIAHHGAVLAVLLPTGGSGVDLATVTKAFTRLRRVNWGRGVRTLSDLPARSARAFWPATGTRRMFEVRPAAVPDTRPLDRDWTIADALALSLGMVLRDRPDLAGQGGGKHRHRDTAARVRRAGLEVHAVERVMEGDLSRYVHRTDPSRVVQPYRARLSLGGLLDDRSLVCVGQSRHLGGGLLVPVGEA